MKKIKQFLKKYGLKAECFKCSQAAHKLLKIGSQKVWFCSGHYQKWITLELELLALIKKL